MFVLLKRARAWRAEMQARGVFSAGELAELEDHLLEEAGRLTETGQSDDEAFVEALRRMGTSEELVTQFGLSHALSGAPVGVWVGRLLPWLLRLCRWLRGLVVFCLPGFAMAIPGLLAARLTTADVFPAVLPVFRQDLPAMTVAWRALATSSWAHLWWSLPLLLGIVLLPTLHRVRHLRDGGDASVAAVLADEIDGARPLLLAGVLAYPLVATGLVQAAFGPLFGCMSKLGG